MTRLQHNVKRLLSDYNWTQRDLAEALGVHPQNLSRTLRGKNSPSIEYLECIADVLSVDICDLLQPLPVSEKTAG